MMKIRSVLSHKLRGFVVDNSGTTAIEYTIMASGIALVIVGAITLLGDRLRVFYNSIAAAVS